MSAGIGFQAYATIRAMRQTMLDELFELLRQYNLRGQFASHAYGTECSPLDAYLLVELDIDQSRTYSELAELLSVETSTISRAVTRLLAASYLVRSNSTADRRRRPLTLAKKGRRFLQVHDSFNNKFIATLSEGLSTTELKEICSFLDYLADKDGAKPLKLRSSESALLSGVRRLARSWNVLGDSFLGSKYNVMHWQLLFELRRAAIGIRPSELSELLRVPRNTFSQIARRFAAEKLIDTKKMSSDQRGQLITLSAGGKSAVEKIRELGRKRLANALLDISDESLARSVSLVRRYVGNAPKVLLQQSREMILQERIVVSSIMSTRDRTEARRFVLGNLPSSGATVAIARGNCSWWAVKENVPMAVLDICPQPQPKVVGFISNFDGKERRFGRDFARSALSMYFAESKCPALHIPPTSQLWNIAADKVPSSTITVDDLDSIFP